MTIKIEFRSIAPLAAACVIALLLAGGSPGPSASAASAGVSAVSPGAARIWIYRDYEPYGSRNFAPIALNGAVVGHSPPDGSAFYRDVAPGRYHIMAVSDGTDVNQDKFVELAPGQEVFVKILASNTWEAGGDTHTYRRDTYYVQIVPPQIARAELPAHPLTGG